MAIARLSGGPLDGQVLPAPAAGEKSLIVPFGEGQLVYRREGRASHTGRHDGPTEERFVFVESTEDIDPDHDGRDS